MAMDYESVSKQILDKVGGSGNIASAEHCMTRLRLILNDESKADDEAVKAIKGVKSVIKQGGQYQVVIGNEVGSLFPVFKKAAGIKGDAAAAPAKAEGPIIQRIFGFVAGIMTPLLPGMLGTGMVKVLLTLLTAMGVIDASQTTYIILYGMADSFFYFLPILLGWSIAKKTNHSVPLFMIIGAALIYPDFVTMMSGAGAIEGIKYGTFLGQNCVYLFGFIPVICTTYTSSMLPMALMAPVMVAVEDFADRVSPNLVKSFLKPMLFCLICTPIVVCVLGPLGGVIGTALASVFAMMYGAVPWLTVAILSALMPFIVMTGMHYALLPLFMSNIANLGYDVVILVTMFCSNIAQGGACFGVAAKTKDIETKSEGLACGISAAVAGITEPGMYGINLRFMKPMYAAVAAAGLSGLWCGLTGVKGYTMGGSPSFMSLITFIGGDASQSFGVMHGVVFGAIGGVVSLVVAAVLAYILYNDKDAGVGVAPSVPVAEEAEPNKKLVEQFDLVSPMEGTVVPLAEVPDEVFASGALGEGVAILPTDGNVYAPCDGAITTLMDSRHAIGMVADNGVELLIHVGLDTVAMNGAPFEYKIKQDQEVKKGDLLLVADLKAIEAAGYKLFTPIIVTNSEDYVSIKPTAEGTVAHGDKLMTIA